tara:strand:+ start:242 stop:742 length:501 start_codon:yes stop_codon:yes gene_type:complete
MANLVMDGVTLASKSGSDITIQNTNVHFPAGHVIQVIQGTAAEQSQNGSNIVLINESFTPKFSGSKFYVSFTIPNLTGDASIYFQADAYIGTSATPTSNQQIIYCRTHGQGTGASDTMTLNGTDFGSYTSPNTNTHYVALLATTNGSWTIARHSATIKLQCMEISQ